MPGGVPRQLEWVPAGRVMSDLLIIGSGLIGTSIGLALRDAGSWDVTITDRDAGRVDLASNRGAGRRWDGQETAAVVLVAAPTFATAAVLLTAQRQNLGVTYTHVSSVQAGVQAEVEKVGQASSLVGGHPMSGNERSGPAAADAALFAGRPWVLCPSPASGPVARQAVSRLVTACGGIPVEMTAAAHDEAVALVSHLPQVTASLLAGALLNAEASAATLAGPGLADTTRIAASSPELWVDLLTANAAHVAPLLHALAGELLSVSGALAELAGQDAATSRIEALAVVRAALERGQAGRALIPIKRGVLEERFARVPVAVPDQPGQLAGLLVAAAGAGVNVEDVRVEHVPGRPRGVIELLVDRDASGSLAAALAAQGWDVLTAS